MTDADYVVVGAGSAGCAVACRLVEGGAKVALLEAGPKDRDIRIHVPAALRPPSTETRSIGTSTPNPSRVLVGGGSVCRAARCWAALPR